mgnify:FL=1
MAAFEQGIYENCLVTGQGFLSSKTKGTPGFYLRIQPYTDGPERDITWWLTDKTVEYVVRDLRKLGFNGRSFGELNPESGTHHSFVGDFITAECQYEKGEDGKDYERWQLPYEGREIKPLERSEQRRLNNLFDKFLKDGKPVERKDDYSEPIADVDSELEDDSSIPF